MREQLHTIPVNEAFESGDECPFCWLRRQAERSALRYVAGPGASYMETEVREATNKSGFCPTHMKKLYDYGNTLGAALILQTHYDEVLKDFRREAEQYQLPPKKTLLPRKKQEEAQPWWERLAQQAESCYICDKVNYNMERYYLTFFTLLKEPEFREKVLGCKGFCLAHLGELLRYAREYLPNSQREWFFQNIFPLAEENLVRVKGDLDWLIAKYDYRNASADWGNSRDALPRAMQKLEGIHPSDPPYKAD